MCGACTTTLRRSSTSLGCIRHTLAMAHHTVLAVCMHDRMGLRPHAASTICPLII